jgi:hypothetical protein
LLVADFLFRISCGWNDVTPPSLIVPFSCGVEARYGIRAGLVRGVRGEGRRSLCGWLDLYLCGGLLDVALRLSLRSLLVRCGVGFRMQPVLVRGMRAQVPGAALLLDSLTRAGDSQG